MGKVYDALRRAEEQRAERRGDVSAVPAAAEPSGTAAPARTADAPRAPSPPSGDRKSVWSRLTGRRGAEAVENTGAANKRRIALLQPDSFVAEQFRTLRARIDSIAAAHPDHPVRTIAVSSALRGDGKTTASIGLASVTAMGVGTKVLLVDADLRDPTVGRSLGLNAKVGLAEVLRGDAMPEEAIVPVEGTTLEVLPVRSVPPNPAELLASSAMRELLAHLSSRYDRIILDLPPTLGLPDAKTVAEMCDGIVFVVRAEQTPRQDVAEAVELLDRRRILGLLLNGAHEEAARYDYRAT